ncbi:hypothetical protein [Solibacillus daqui]|uniref:hypothetical protein n=1 Tax=Solibacillus daqui TaxID=2912187 RepID=UPI0023667D13|nr:hypothetical protein [Solibacillus daqui]
MKKLILTLIALTFVVTGFGMMNAPFAEGQIVTKESKDMPIYNDILMMRLVESALNFAGAMASDNTELATQEVHTLTRLDASNNALTFTNGTTLNVMHFSAFSLANFELSFYDEENLIIGLKIDDQIFALRFERDEMKDNLLKIIEVTLK